MSLVLKKEFIHNISESSDVEWLERNPLGIYGASSCIGMNTRREHGLFVAPDYNQKKKVVLISKFEESVFIENRLHEISTNKYDGGIFPSGYEYIEEFSKRPFPKVTFNVENRIIEKTVFVAGDHPLMAVRYELKNQGLPVNIIAKPFIADRYSTELTSEMQGLNTDSYQGQNFVRWALKPQLPEVYVYYNRGEFVSANLWYKNFHYKNDDYRYGKESEHLFNPGFFQATLKPYQALILYISSAELDVEKLNYEALYRSEAERRRNRAYKTFSVEERVHGVLKNATYRLQGRPALNISTLQEAHATRDILFSIPGAYLALDKADAFKEIYALLAEQLQEGLLPANSPHQRSNYHYCAADLSLWLINLAYLYYEKYEDVDFIEANFDTLRTIFDYYKRGTLFNIFCDKDGLIFSGSKAASTGWLPLKNENNDVLRYGKLLEINALWYNALKVLEHFGELAGKKRWASKFERQAGKVEKAFKKVFEKKEGGYYDCVNHNSKLDDFRINQLLLVCLPFSLINSKESAALIEDIEEKLYTAYGIKSADREITLQHASALGRKAADYYDGAIWPWAMGFFAEALSRRGIKKDGLIKDYFQKMEKMLDFGVIDHLPEAVLNADGIKQAGMRDFLPSTAMYVWTKYIYKNF